VNINAAAAVEGECTGLRIEDFQGTSMYNTWLIRAGSITPTATSGLFAIAGNFAAAANQTPLYVTEGATPTLRQLRTRVWDATAGHGFTNGDLVCILV